MAKSWNLFKPYVLASPQAIALSLFLIFPILLIGVVSFWDFNGYAMTPAFTLDNYISVLTSGVTLKTYLNTFKFVGLVWLCTLLMGLPGGVFFVLSCAQTAVAGAAVFGLYHSFLDVQHYPDDFLGAAVGQGRIGQSTADGQWDY